MSVAEPILPSADEILSPGLVKLIALRPRVLDLINSNSGVYSHIIAGWRAQIVLELGRLSHAVQSNRLDLAVGQELRDLIQSEFAPLPDLTPIKAIGSVVMTRLPAVSLPSGVIPAGSKFRRPSITTSTPAVPAVADATYETISETYVPQGTLAFELPIQAVLAGSVSNQIVVNNLGSSNIVIVDSIFDPKFTVDNFSAAGGSDGFTDPQLRQYARAYISGQYAPVNGALMAGALGAAGAKHAAIRDTGTGVATVFIADATWAGAPYWSKTVKQALYDRWVGFGCVVDVKHVTNKAIGVIATVRVTDSSALYNTADIEKSIHDALTSYFDDRVDWYAWKLNAVRSVIAHSDKRILSCTTVSVVDAAGAPLAEPVVSASLLYHYMLSGAVNINFVLPN